MSPSSRRALLAAAAGGTIALAVDSLARPQPAQAHDPDDVLLGGVNESTSTTVLNNWESEQAVLRAEGVNGSAIDARSGAKPAILAVSDVEVGVSAVSKQRVGILGYGGEPDGTGGSSGGSGTTGVAGYSGAGFGVAGMCKSGEGIHGSSETGTGVYGQGNEGVHGDGDMAGVFGGSTAGTGVRGRSSTGWGVTGDSEGTQFGASGGVFGLSDKTVGVFGLSAEGIAVEGRSDHEPATGTGVKGYSREGTGVHGESSAGSGVHGESEGIGVEGLTTGVTTQEGMLDKTIIAVAGRVQGEGGYGIAVYGQGANGLGVLGEGGACGVHGAGGTVGVEGKSESGVGVTGTTQDGYAISANVFGSGTALIAHGPVVFDSAGRVTIPQGAPRLTVAAPFPLLTGSSKILVTLLGNAQGSGKKAVPIYLSHVEISDETRFDIVLTGPAGRAVDAAFFVIK